MRIPVLSLTLPALLLCVSLPAQTNSAQTKPIQTNPVSGPAAADYAAESYVVLRSDAVFAMNADGTGTRSRTMAVRLQSDAAVREFGVVGIPFASASEKVEFQYVRVRRPDGTVVESPLTDLQEQPAPVTREAPFYSDLKEKQLPVKSLRLGDTLEWQVRIVRTKAEAPGEFWGQAGFIEEGVALQNSVELRVPAAKTVKVWTSPEFKGKPIESVVGDQRVYRWEHTNLKPTTGPEADAEKKRKEKTPLTPAEELDAKEGALPPIAWTTFPSWEAVGTWYRGLEGTRMQPDDAVKAKVAEITAGRTTDEAKVQAVYAYVSSNVRYIGVALGIGRYQPHHAEEVLENQYGDCKDKHTLLAAMLTALGLHPDAVLIGSQIRFNDAVPSPTAFNHLITRVQVGGQVVWLDATAEVAPYRMLSATIRDKQALVVPETGAPKIERTPTDPPFASFVTMTAKGSLDAEGTSNSHLTLTVRGDDELLLRQVLRQVAPAQYGELMQRLSGSMGYGGTTSHPEIGRPEDTAEPLSFRYDYTRDKAGDWPNLRTLPQLYPTSLPTLQEKEPPIAAIPLGWPRTERSTSELKLPDGWGVILPDPIHETSSWATYDLTCRFEKGTLYAERTIVVLKKELPQADWKRYLKWQEAAGIGTEPYIQLVRNGTKDAAPASTAKSGALPATSAENVAKAHQLVLQAIETEKKKPDNVADPQQQNEIARVLLRRAENLDDHALGLWAAYATIELAQHNYVDSVKHYQRELGFHPDEYPVYQALALAQIAANQRLDAMGTYRSWAKADPTDPKPVTRMLNMLLADGDAAAAVALSETALPKLPEEKQQDFALQYALAQAQVKAGLASRGEATLLALLKSTDDVGRRNDIAYTLADANLQLPLAESTQREVLAQLTAESAGWTLSQQQDQNSLQNQDPNQRQQAQQTALQIAAWDTMGWILFRAGRLPEAEVYLQAAWRNTPRPVLGQHLGDLKLAQGDKTGAMEIYQFTSSRTKSLPNAGSKELEQRIDRLTKEGVKSVPIAELYPRMQAMAQAHLGPWSGASNGAEYRLLIHRGGVLQAEPSGPRTVPGGQQRLRTLKTAPFFPPDSEAKIVRRVYLSCTAKGCDALLQ